MNVEAKELKAGQRILVDLGNGEKERTVDMVSYDQEGGFVTVILFSPDGYNPKFRVREDVVIKRVH